VNNLDSIFLLQNVMKAVRTGKYKFSVKVLERNRLESDTKLMFLECEDGELELRAIAQLVLDLIERNKALWLLTEEGKAAQTEAVAKGLFVGATNPSFTIESAREMAKELSQ
jgi:hypothetical protein